MTVHVELIFGSSASVNMQLCDPCGNVFFHRVLSYYVQGSQLVTVFSMYLLANRRLISCIQGETAYYEGFVSIVVPILAVHARLSEGTLQVKPGPVAISVRVLPSYSATHDKLNPG